MDSLFDNDKSIIVFSIPRSGTHLTMQHLMNLGYEEWFPEVAKYGIDNTFKSPNNKKFVFAGHLEFNSWKDKFIESNLNGIYVTRNPLDVIVSQSYYIKDKERGHPLYNTFQDLDYEECMNIIINGNEDFNSIFERYKNNDGWLELPNVINLKYEDLLNKVVNRGYYQFYFRNGHIGEWKQYKNVNWEKVMPFARSRGYKI